MILKPREGSKWYGSKNAKSGDIITILDEAKWIEKEFEGEKIEKLSCEIEVNGTKKIYDMYNSARVALEEAFGSDTAKWIGHKARVMLAPTPKGDAKMILLEALFELDEPTPF